MPGRARGVGSGTPVKARISQMKRLTCIDLFCGCGGFTLGMERAGFSTLAAADSNQEAITVFRKNFPSVPHILHEDLTLFSPTEMAHLIGHAAPPLVGDAVGNPALN